MKRVEKGTMLVDVVCLVRGRTRQRNRTSRKNQNLSVPSRSSLLCLFPFCFLLFIECVDESSHEVGGVMQLHRIGVAIIQNTNTWLNKKTKNKKQNKKQMTAKSKRRNEAE